MPTIELTQEQADELMDLLLGEIILITAELPKVDPVHEVELQHRRHVLSEIAHLLEIA